MKNRKTMTRSVCPCGGALGSHGDKAVRDMSRLRVWLWEWRHKNHGVRYGR